MNDLTHTNSMMNEIRELLINARQRVAVQVNTDRIENNKTHAGSCRTAQYVSELLCRRSKRRTR